MVRMSRSIPIDFDTIQHLQKQLQYAETRECRASMPETDWLIFRRELTDRFKKALELREFLLKVDASKKSYEILESELLKKMNINKSN